MGREKRKQSKTGIYHVMLRGIDKRYIFEEDEDKEKFLQCLHKSKEKAMFQVLGYCLMDNHVHLLIKEGKETLGQSIKRITVSYVQWHNRKYDRVGHLFQNRFNSECIETDSYLLTVARYIHQNPVKAGLVKDISEYIWSSYRAFFKVDSLILDKENVLGYFNEISDFVNFMSQSNMDKCMDDEIRKTYSDDALINNIEEICNIRDIQKMDKTTRNKVISKIKAETKASNRQISRVIGVGRGIVERVK